MCLLDDLVSITILSQSGRPGKWFSGGVAFSHSPFSNARARPDERQPQEPFTTKITKDTKGGLNRGRGLETRPREDVPVFFVFSVRFVVQSSGPWVAVGRRRGSRFPISHFLPLRHRKRGAG